MGHRKRTRRLVEKKAKEGQAQLSELEKQWQLKEQDLVYVPEPTTSLVYGHA